MADVGAAAGLPPTTGDGATPAQGQARRPINWGMVMIQFGLLWFAFQNLLRPGPDGKSAPQDLSATVDPTPTPTERPVQEWENQFNALQEMISPKPIDVRTRAGELVNPKSLLTNAWPDGDEFKLEVYASTAQRVSLEDARDGMYDAELWWEEAGLTFDFDEGNNRELVKDWALPDHVRLNNGSLTLHAFLVHRLYESAAAHKDMFVAQARYQIVVWRNEKVKVEGRSLLGNDGNDPKARSLLGWSARRKTENHTDKVEGDVVESPDICTDEHCGSESAEQDLTSEPDASAEESATKKVTSGKSTGPKRRTVHLLIPELLLQFVPPGTVTRYSLVPPKAHSFPAAIKLAQMPPPVVKLFVVTDNKKSFLPLTTFSDFWVLREHMIEINETVRSVPLKINFGPIGIYKFQLMQQMDFFWAKQVQLGSQEDADVDLAKQAILETNPYLLAVTVVVTLAHTVLEFLAFSSDIKHWRSVKSMEGVSVRSMFWKVGMEVVVFLYLVDNDTSFMIRAGVGFGIAIEVWKLGKAVRPKNIGQRKLFGVIPWFDLEEKESYSKSSTKEHDATAMKYLSYVLYPLVTGYALYSLVYDDHKGWYSWILSSLVSVVYMFGFIMMFPQIFINYKLKSVAHLPMKAFMYKALNTFIDDLFSFIIKMPTMHRLACFRDDIVFIIFLYQRWKYPVDKTRVNEFGQVFDENNESAQDRPKKKRVVKKVIKKVVVKRKKQPETTDSSSAVASGSSGVPAVVESKKEQ